MNNLAILLKKLIRNSAGHARYTVAVTGLSIAVFLLLAAVQIQVNYKELLHGKKNQDSIANFLVINKILTDANMGNTALEDTVINDIKKQSFVQSVGLLTPGRFKASIQSNSDRFPFYTDISFESIPKEFIDVSGTDWTWNEAAPYVPIIIPNMFLDFYNFQFSLSQDLPQLTPEIVKMIVFKVTVYGPKGTASFNGKIAGFSDRISSMLVPSEFMDWGNRNFASEDLKNPSRLIIRTRDPGNPALSNYLRKHQLTTDTEKTRFSKYRKAVDTVVAISGITGALMLLFALLVFTLFIQLTIASCKEEINLLIILGTAPRQLSRFLIMRFFPANVWMIAASFVTLTVLQYLMSLYLESRHIFVSGIISLYTLGTAILLVLLIWWVNRKTIRDYIYPRS
ncbi:MAG TPA: hypothetical protein VJ552_12160 [Sediminibacterium sp.]|nr:hypothetical protein [Sediminibacterium sp.]